MQVHMAFKDEINYEMISQINKKERKSSKLIRLDPDFYLALISHLKELQEEYNKRYSESTTSTEALLLNNEICKLDNIIKEIYTRRERKIILAALDLGNNTDSKNMLEHEKQLYNILVNTLKNYRNGILAQKPNPICSKINQIYQLDHHLEQSEQIYSTPDEIETLNNNIDLKVESNVETIEKPDNSEIEAMTLPAVELSERSVTPTENQTENNSEQNQNSKGASETFENSKSQPPTTVDISGPGSETVLVYVLEDLNPFIGTDLETYSLKKEDLATIPKKNAEILKKNNKINFVNVSI